MPSWFWFFAGAVAGVALVFCLYLALMIATHGED
jgi:hypothetical protein